MNHMEKQRKYWFAFIAAGMIGYSGSLFASQATIIADGNSKQQLISKTNNEKIAAVNSDDIASEAKEYPNEDHSSDFNNDPFERFNRAFFMFNDKLDFFIIKPIAIFYNAVVPKPLNVGIHNFFTNFGEIVNVANDILQLNLHQFANDAWRFTLNSTFGLAGFIDIATRMGLPYHANDFGLTLSKWGYRNSTYFVFPILGPSTIRDGMSLVIDYYAFSLYPYIEPQSRRFAVLGLFFIDHRANLLQFEPVLEEAAIDKYVFMRNAYMQHRQFQIDQVIQKDSLEGVVEATG